MTMQSNVPLEVSSSEEEVQFSLEHQSFGNVGVSCSFFQPSTSQCHQLSNKKRCQTVVSANMNDERSFKPYSLKVQLLKCRF